MGRDATILFLARGLRMFIFGATALVLVLYLSQLGLTDSQIGLLLNVTLLGDAAISIIVVRFADSFGRKQMLLIGCFLKLVGAASMASQGGLVGHSSFALLVTGATIGVISPSGNEVGPFQALEQSILSDIVPAGYRTEVFAWYSLLGYVSTAFGSLVAGVTVSFLVDHGLESTRAYSFIFQGYGLLALVLIAFTLSLSSDVESPQYQSELAVREGEKGEEQEGIEGGLRTPLITSSSQTEPSIEPRPKKLGWDSLSQDSRATVFSLSSLFALDAFAGSMVTGSLLAYWFQTRFQASDSYLGSILFGANLIAGPSSLLSGWVAKRCGLINTMVWTHLPSNILLILIPLMPTLELAALMTFLRNTISQMDVVPRSSYVSGIVRPEERTFVMGYVNVVKSLASASGPLVTTHLASNDLFSWSFYLAGGIKIVYDLLLLWSFKSRRADHETVG